MPSAEGWCRDQFAPRLDGAERSGLKSWSVADIVEYLQSGRNGHSHAVGLMAEVVVNSTSKMSDDDVRAIATYLKDLPAGEPEPNVIAPSPAQMADGEKIYKGACIACHEADGSGAPRIYPPLPGKRQCAVGDCRKHAAHHPEGRADRDDTAGAQSGIDAGICREVVGSGDRRCRDLYPQRLGQLRLGGDGSAGGQGAAALI